MSSMAGALPNVAYRGGHHPQGPQARYQQQPSTPSMMTHMGQYGGPHPMSMGEQNFYGQQQMQQYYAAGQMPSPHGATPMPPRQSMPYYQPHMAMSPSQAGYYYQSMGQYPTHGHSMMGQVGGQYGSRAPGAIDVRYSNTVAEHHVVRDSQGHTQPTRNPLDGRQSAVRGPPRKPRQSGHAIWIGNLPPQTDLMSLVHHVCKEAPGLQSLFLISKSNCAFANFKDEETCKLAQESIHDSKFHSVRLVSRLRKNTVESASGHAAPTGPASTTPTPLSPRAEAIEESPPADGRTTATESANQATPTETGSGQQDKFFILKSLTVEDLELSVRTGIWATQSHNEESLNGAFKSVDNVFLVFSANKSGEYFGYAKMLSEINNDPAAAIEFAPTTHATTDLNLPKAIITDVTEFAPRGRIIDDSARGTIFWEIDKDDSDAESDAGSEASSHNSQPAEEGGKTWGKPFKLEWLSTNRLPFYRTRGLRNPWNSNREVKIARDGTELEPSVGRRLIGIFNRAQSPGPMGAMLGQPMGPIPPGYHQMRPYGQ
ncbi:hypothetical protein LIA77_05435 [Sarocladium implicatum]|nr:hypothetical protein LIA77_05435 [Sarocladium implicatum]